MKKFILFTSLILLIFQQNIISSEPQTDAYENACRNYEIFARNAIIILNNVYGTSTFTNKHYLAAEEELKEACKKNECTITNLESRILLQKHELVDAHGNVKEEVCTVFNHLENNQLELVAEENSDTTFEIKLKKAKNKREEY